MTRKPKIIHRVSVNTGQPLVVARRGGFGLRRSRLVRRRVARVFYGVGFVLSMGAISQAGYGFLMETPYFMVKEPVVTGVSEGLRKEIVGLVGSLAGENRNLFGIDAGELEKQIGLHPRIRDIHVEKVYPDELRIVAAERQEVAIISTEKGFFLLDHDGYVMEQLQTGDLMELDFPFVSGLGAEEVYEGEAIGSVSLRNAINLLQVLKARNEQLYHEISEIEIGRDRGSSLETLTAHMKGGLHIRFGDADPVERLPALETMLVKMREEGVKPFEDLVYIDLGFEGLGISMDKETALLVKRNQFNQVKSALDAATERYERNNPVDRSGQLRYGSVPASGSGGSSSRGSAGSSSSGNSGGSSRSSSGSSARAASGGGVRQQAPAAGYYQQPGYQAQRGYQQQPYGGYAQPYGQQQYGQPQYQQQYRQQPNRGGQRSYQQAPMYNLPANQSRY